MKKIEIIVAPDGQVRLETRGFQGAECQAASQFLERALGRKTGEQLTAEYHRVATNQQAQAKQRG
jgi:hypothetical protein